MERIDNKVAFGVVFSDDGELSKDIHGIPMKSGCLRVSVDGCISPNALLPVPIPGEMETVEQVVGAHVAWPENMISYPTSVVCM